MKNVTVTKKSGGFARFKKKLRRSAFFKALVFGLSCGLLSAAVVILYQKLTTVPPELLLYLPVGTGVAVIMSLLAFLILRPSEKKIAEKLDRDLALGEKVQTMLAYQNEDSDMLTLQREDADERLLKAPARAVRYKHPWLHAFVPLLACAVTAVAIMTPVKAVELPPEEPEPPFELSSWQETALLELIEDVKASEMETSPKDASVDALEVLLAALRVTDTEADMKAMVITVIANLNKIIREHNSANTISPYLTVSEHEKVSGLAMSLDMLNGLEAREALADARDTLKVDEVAEPLAAYLTALNSVMAEVAETVAEDDELYIALDTLAKDLSEVSRVAADYTRDWAQTQLDTVFNNAANNLSDALYIQYVNKDVKNMAVARLMEIFEISEDELPAEEQQQIPSDDEKEEEDKQDEEERGDQGAPGEAEVLFGSDDVIYDPVKNEYVKYGDVINEYFAAVSEKIIDGQTPDSLEQFISDYFATLYDGSDRKSES